MGLCYFKKSLSCALAELSLAFGWSSFPYKMAALMDSQDG